LIISLENLSQKKLSPKNNRRFVTILYESAKEETKFGDCCFSRDCICA